MSASGFCVLLFRSVSHAMLAERILKKQDIPHKVIPVPRRISSDCGVCIRFRPDERARIESALSGKVEVLEIRAI